MTGTPREVMLRELPEGVVATFTAMPNAFRDFAFTMRHGFTPATVERAAAGFFDAPRVEVPGGLAMNWPTRALEASDVFFRSLAREQELAAGAYTPAGPVFAGRLNIEELRVAPMELRRVRTTASLATGAAWALRLTQAQAELHGGQVRPMRQALAEREASLRGGQIVLAQVRDGDRERIVERNAPLIDQREDSRRREKHLREGGEIEPRLARERLARGLALGVAEHAHGPATVAEHDAERRARDPPALDGVRCGREGALDHEVG